MPELPEVETVVRGLRPDLVGRCIKHVWYNWERTIATPAPSEFTARLAGQKIHRVHRRAKYIVLDLDHDHLLIHLKMTGRLYVTEAQAQHDADRWVHVKFGLDGGRELRFSDSRKFGRMYLTSDISQVTNALGPEPLDEDFTLEVLRQRIAGRSRMMKSLLLDQTFVAGVGNIYADETLFRAGIHPGRDSDELDDDDIARLYEGIRGALSAGVEHEGASINWYRKADGNKGTSQEHFFVYGRTGQPCRNCGTPIEKLRLAQRGTHYCPDCQPLWS